MQFSEKGDQIPMKTMAQIIQNFKMPSVQSPQNFAFRTASRLLIEMIQSHRILQPRLNNYPYFFQVFSKGVSALRCQKAVYKKKRKSNNTFIPKRWVMDVSYHVIEDQLKVIIGNGQKKELNKGDQVQGSCSEKMEPLSNCAMAR